MLTDTECNEANELEIPLKEYHIGLGLADGDEIPLLQKKSS